MSRIEPDTMSHWRAGYQWHAGALLRTAAG
jgi:hypothetical protein